MGKQDYREEVSQKWVKERWMNSVHRLQLWLVIARWPWYDKQRNRSVHTCMYIVRLCVNQLCKIGLDQGQVRGHFRRVHNDQDSTRPVFPQSI